MPDINWSLILLDSIDDVLFWGQVFEQDQRDREEEKLQMMMEFGPCAPWMKSHVEPYTYAYAVGHVCKSSKINRGQLAGIISRKLRVEKGSDMELGLALGASRCAPIAVCEKYGLKGDLLENATNQALRGRAKKKARVAA